MNQSSTATIAEPATNWRASVGDQVEAQADALAALIEALTGCENASVILHAHRIPAERYHSIDLPVEIYRNESDGQPSMVSKRLGRLTLFCDHRTLTDAAYRPERDLCPDLEKAFAEWTEQQS